MGTLERPNQQMISKVQNKLEELGIFLQTDYTEVCLAAALDYLFETREGNEWVVDKLGFNWEQGNSNKYYHVADTNTTVTGDDVFFLTSAVVKGRFVPPTHIDDFDIPNERCDDCGVKSHCFKPVIDDKGIPRNICNNCLSASELVPWRNVSGGIDGCRKCSVCTCAHHPSQQQKMVAF